MGGFTVVDDYREKLLGTLDAVETLLNIISGHETEINSLYERIEKLQEENAGLRGGKERAAAEMVVMAELLEKIDAPGVLIVDPLIPVRLSIREILANSGFYVIGEAGDSQQAVTLAKRIKPDLVIISAKLGNGNGIEVLKNLRGIYPGLKAILLTSSSFDVLAAAQLSEARVLAKPINRLRLLELARSMIEGDN